MSVSVQPASASASTSTMRRKPKFTYQSPLPTDVRDPTSLISYSKKTSPPPPPPPPPSQGSGLGRPLSAGPTSPSGVKRKTYMGNTSLPLYHPLGRLALSLPPLDPAKYGLPVLARPDTELIAQQAQLQNQQAISYSNGNTSWRTTPTGAEDGGQTSTTTTTTEKASPRKRRNGGGGGGGGGNRRKRKETEEDASYSAANKRPRYPRGANTNGSVNTEEDGPANGETVNVEEEEKRVVERRTTRSRARRDSTASETTSASTRAASAVRKEDGEIESKRRSRSKEEGEVSEESK
ncbi:hypothetical protein E1B28_009909 [Marasmius oreades]|uniref:Uncharacterized protein n=1 Tax=Marasmius oreades TaxID=181124 RepID=A0A9P7UQL0_9AGAR|nr:uncharacterized protein E1B28_009909 [Marasmius oreades]KAG7090827.1 hypothetical protein E1B28_009909 [Marasmius oreades]